MGRLGASCASWGPAKFIKRQGMVYSCKIAWGVHWELSETRETMWVPSSQLLQKRSRGHESASFAEAKLSLLCEVL